jgi:hypothetical protein
MLKQNLIHNTSVTYDNVTHATDIYGGPEVGLLKGKTVRQFPMLLVQIPDLIPLPDEIQDRHKIITLCADVCQVDRLRFLMTISHNLHKDSIKLEVNTLLTTY